MSRKHLLAAIAGVMAFFSLVIHANAVSINGRIAQCKRTGDELRKLDASSYESKRQWEYGKYTVTFFLTEGSVKLISIVSKKKIPEIAASFLIGKPIEYAVDYVNDEIFKFRVNQIEKECLSKSESGDIFDPGFFMFDNIGVRRDNMPDKIAICNDGTVYSLSVTGTLFWYRYNEQRTGSQEWANNGRGIPVGYGWDELQSITCVDSGIFYAINRNGELLYYRHIDWQTGKGEWSNRGSGRIIGRGWGNYRSILGGGEGIIYAIKKNGELAWYRHNGWKSGREDWENDGKEMLIGKGWNDYVSIISAGHGIIYGLKGDGELFWYFHEGWKDGTSGWANQGTGRLVGKKWDVYQQIFASSNGRIYAMTGGKLLFLYHHRGWQEGDMNWSNGGNGKIIKEKW